MTQAYSDLEVVAIPTHHKHLSDLHTTSSQYDSYSTGTALPAYDSDKMPFSPVAPPRTKLICGLSKRTFLIIAVIAVIIIGAAIGGGVGATVNKSSASPSSNTVNFTSSISTPSSTTALSTTTIVGPSATLLSDCPSSNNTIYTPPSSTQQFRKICGKACVNANNFNTSITVQVSTLNDCISACAAFNVESAVDIKSGAKRICNAVCWRSTGGDFSGWCYGHTTQNSTGQFVYGAERVCNSAALINQ